MKKSLFNIKDIVEIALFIALAIVLDLPLFKIKIFANGGSISLVMVPLFFLAYRKGFIKSFISIGIIYGLIDCYIDGFLFVTYPLDYLLAIGSISLAGLFKNKILNNSNKTNGIVYMLISILIVFVSRCMFHTLSGMIIYKLDFVPSLVYQLTYLVPSFIIVSIALIVLFEPFKRINARFK